jgi:hypothetical protein
MPCSWRAGAVWWKNEKGKKLLKTGAGQMIPVDGGLSSGQYGIPVSDD